MSRTNRTFVLFCILAAAALTAHAGDEQKDPWTGKYPMSMFTRTRSANCVGKGRLSLSVKIQSINSDEMLIDNCHKPMSETDENSKLTLVPVAKYGWAQNHHLALGIPYLYSDFESSSKDIEENGLGNIFVFEKWKFLDETRSVPGMAVDLWYYFPTGDSAKKLGSDDASVKLTVPISKSWKHANVHFHPGYRWNLDEGCDITEINLGVLSKVHKKLLLGVEYNYTDKEEKGDAHDLVPGLIWKPIKGGSVKLGAVINLDSTMTYREDVGFVMKLFYKI